MDSLKNKLEKNIEIFNTQAAPFHLKKVETIKNNGFYERLINWVSGEFDLFLQDESDNLKVYFSNGWFMIRSFKNEKSQECIEIKVEGKSRIVCQKMMSKLEIIYNHVALFTEIRSNKYLELSNQK